MISDQLKDTLVDQIVKELIGQGTDGIRSILELIFNVAMKIEREQFLGATQYERTEERKGYANGYKPKTLQTRLGSLELKPKPGRSRTVTVNFAANLGIKYLQQ